MITFNIDFEVKCDCGRELTQQTSLDEDHHGYVLTVEPCSDCLDTRYDEGEEEGHKEGFDEGHDEGKAEGYKEGFDEGKEEEGP